MFQWIINMFNHHGYIVLFLSLFLELLALPLPGELLMGSAGLLVYEGKLNWIGIIIVGGLGASIGITVSYFIGYWLGMPFVQKYGKYVHFGEDKLEQTSRWFSTYGNKLLTIAYFIPGLRHFTGYFAGIVRIPFRTFALYAYTGSFLWVGIFVSIGRLLGPQWETYHNIITKYLLIGAALLGVILLIIYFVKKRGKYLIKGLLNLPKRSHHLFHSLGRIKFFVSLMAAAFLIFCMLTAGLIQDYLENEFDQFNQAVMVMIASLQEDFSFQWVRPASALVSLPAVNLIIIGILFWIWMKGKDKKLEVSSFIITLIGGKLWGELLTSVFQRIGKPTPTESSLWLHISFPSEPMLTAVVIYGYITFLLFRHSSLRRLNNVVVSIFVALLIWIGLNDLLIANQLPSSIVAGISFGGVWVTLQIVLLEIFRILRSPAAIMSDGTSRF